MWLAQYEDMFQALWGGLGRGGGDGDVLDGHPIDTVCSFPYTVYKYYFLEDDDVDHFLELKMCCGH